MATGVSGLDWDDVRPVIEKTFEDSDVNLYLYTTYVLGQAAAE